ncbi:quinone oxidoreductase family protein [Acidithrix ferrooxidans]|uniref:Mycocerosic acid synthase n=1 Tax=Acidithrix ferrooxidans TaxID=1280514 RepID=A0A0D8HE25_9ACTN|nr:zinc-binding alcohol dehydrogenase family protein [Acidithrix ferrooxidans]KJF16134.1 mycocerosic acid synthase [Acidithrix ferrooxidans]
MQAIVVNNFGAPENMELVERPNLSISQNQVLIKTIYSSVNFADIMAVTGNYPGGPPPFTPGIDTYGTIVEVGALLSPTLIGQKVMAFCDSGGYGQYTTATDGLFFIPPSNLSDEEAGAAPLLIGTTYALVHKAATLAPGDSILIHAGAGGIGTTAIQMARAMGASKILALVSTPAKIPVVEELGAIGVLYGDDYDYPQEIRKIAPEGIDISLNSVAGETIGADLKILNSFGTIVAFGMASSTPGIAYSNELHPTSRSICGYSFGNLRRNRPHLVAPIMEEGLKFLEDGSINLSIGSIYDLGEAALAHRAILSRASTGKILLRA